MWLIDVFGALAIAAMAVLVVRNAAPRRAGRDGDAATARHSGFLLAALLALVASVGLALWAAVIDFRERTYQVAWLVMGSASLGLAALAWALFTFSLPRPHRSGWAEAAAWVAVVFAFGVGCCYGVLFGENLRFGG